jgi:hypothetical protein
MPVSRWSLVRFDFIIVHIQPNPPLARVVVSIKFRRFHMLSSENYYMDFSRAWQNGGFGIRMPRSFVV